MKILITGGGGFIGSNLTKYHLDKNDQVFVVDNLITGNKKNLEIFLSLSNFHFYQEDILKFDLSEIGRVDIIYHLASPASPPKYQKYPVETLLVNSYGTYQLLEYFKKTKSRTFVFASSSEIYGDPQTHPQSEEYFGNVNPIGIRSCYDEGKRFGESLCMSYFRKYYLDIRIARIFNTYGPNMEKNDGRIISNFVTQGLLRRPMTIYGNGQQTRSCCYISDMVEGLYRLAVRKNIAGQVINMGNPVEKCVMDIAILIKKLTKSMINPVCQPLPDDDPSRRKPNISKAIKLLGWKPKISLEIGLKKTIEYFKMIV